MLKSSSQHQLNNKVGLCTIICSKLAKKKATNDCDFVCERRISMTLIVLTTISWYLNCGRTQTKIDA